MCSGRLSRRPIGCFLIAASLSSGSAAESSERELLTAAGKPAEGPLDVFLGEPRFDMKVVFDEGDHVREPYLAIAVDGTLLAVRNNGKHLRRSEDGGRTWQGILDVPITHSDSNMIVDENTGNIVSVRMWNAKDRVFLSTDHGKTWTEKEVTINPNELMKRWAETSSKMRVTKVTVHAPGTSERTGWWERWEWMAAVRYWNALRRCWRQVSMTVSIVSTKRLPPALCVPKESFRQMTA